MTKNLDYIQSHSHWDNEFLFNSCCRYKVRGHLEEKKHRKICLCIYRCKNNVSPKLSVANEFFQWFEFESLIPLKIKSRIRFRRLINIGAIRVRNNFITYLFSLTFESDKNIQHSQLSEK